MADAQGPLFLERGTYRRRRMMDAVKLIAFLGAGLWMVPVLWPHGDAGQSASVPMSRAVFFIFGIWVLLIILSAWLVRSLATPADQTPQTSDSADTDRQP